MTDKDVIFLLAKVNIIETLCVNQIALLSMLHAGMTRAEPFELIDTLAHNLEEGIRFHSRIVDGDVATQDPIEMQTEMLRQVGPIFQRVKDALATYSPRKEGERP